MESTTYRITLSDGKRIDLIAHSAAQAIGDAIWKYRGRTVVDCYSGMKERDVEMALQIDRGARPIKGHIQHDIPEHQPVAESAIRPRLKPIKDTSEPMFDEDAILSESARAKAATNQPLPVVRIADRKHQVQPVPPV